MSVFFDRISFLLQCVLVLFVIFLKKNVYFLAFFIYIYAYISIYA